MIINDYKNIILNCLNQYKFLKDTLIFNIIIKEIPELKIKKKKSVLDYIGNLRRENNITWYENLTEKMCYHCNIIQSIDNFNNSKHTKDNKSCYCKECESQIRKKKYIKNKEKILANQKIYRINNREKVLEGKKKHYQENKEHYKQYNSSPEVKKRKNERIKVDRKKNPEKYKEKDAKYYAKYPEKFKEYNSRRDIKDRKNAWKKLDRKKNPEKYRQQNKRNYEKYKEEHLTYSKAYRKTEKGRAVENTKSHNRRSIYGKGNVTGEYQIMLKNNTIDCEICHVEMDDNGNNTYGKQTDHIIPLWVGGRHDMDNIRIICRKCNNDRPHDCSDLIDSKYSYHLFTKIDDGDLLMDRVSVHVKNKLKKVDSNL